jgi:hypothetical protein
MREHAQQNISYHIKNYDNITSRDQRGKKIKYNDRSIKHKKKKKKKLEGLKQKKNLLNGNVNNPI